MKTSIVRRSLAALALILLTLATGLPAYAGDATPTPIPIPTQANARPVPGFIGHEATPQPIAAPAIRRTRSWHPVPGAAFTTTPT